MSEARQCMYFGVIDRKTNYRRECRGHAKRGRWNCARHQLEERQLRREGEFA